MSGHAGGVDDTDDEGHHPRRGPRRHVVAGQLDRQAGKGPRQQRIGKHLHNDHYLLFLLWCVSGLSVQVLAYALLARPNRNPQLKR